MIAYLYAVFLGGFPWLHPMVEPNWRNIVYFQPDAQGFRLHQGAPTARATASTGSSKTFCGTWKAANAPVDSHLPGIWRCLWGVLGPFWRGMFRDFWEIPEKIDGSAHGIPSLKGVDRWSIWIHMGYLGDGCLDLRWLSQEQILGDLLKFQWQKHQKYQICPFGSIKPYYAIIYIYTYVTSHVSGNGCNGYWSSMKMKNNHEQSESQGS